MADQIVTERTLEDSLESLSAAIDRNHEYIDTLREQRDALLVIAKEIAAWQHCDEPNVVCDSSSGPYCQTHGDNYMHVDLIQAARAAIAKAEGRS
jgi:hypothetical protein